MEVMDSDMAVDFYTSDGLIALRKVHSVLDMGRLVGASTCSENFGHCPGHNATHRQSSQGVPTNLSYQCLGHLPRTQVY